MKTHWNVGNAPACDYPGTQRRLTPTLTKVPDEVTCKNCKLWIGNTDLTHEERQAQR